MIRKFGSRLVTHFDTHRQRARWPFFWRISVEFMVVGLLIIAGLDLIFDWGERTDLAGFSPRQLVVGAVVFAPLIETLVCQSFPIMLGRRLRLGFWAQVALAIPFFALPHFPSGPGTFIGAGIVGGFYFGFTYVRWRQASFGNAFWMTAGMHALHNLVLIVPYAAYLAFGEGQVE